MARAAAATERLSATLATRRRPRTSPSTSTCRWSASSPPSRRAAGAWRSRSTPRPTPTPTTAPSARSSGPRTRSCAVPSTAPGCELATLLEPLERHVMRVYFADDLSQREIARRLGISQMRSAACCAGASSACATPTRPPPRRPRPRLPPSSPSEPPPRWRASQSPSCSPTSPIDQPACWNASAIALGVVVLGGVGLLAQRRLLAAADVLAPDDPVVVARAHPVEQPADAAHGHRVGEAQVGHQPGQRSSPLPLSL